MSGTVLGLLGVTLAAAMGELLLPLEGKGGTKAFLHFLTALILLLLLVRPFFTFLQTEELPLPGELAFADEEALAADYQQMFSEAVAARSADQLREGVTSLLAQKFQLSEESLWVGVVLNGDGELQEIAVRLSGEALLCDPQEIEAYLKEYFTCKVEVR